MAKDNTLDGEGLGIKTCPRCGENQYVDYGADPLVRDLATAQGITPPALSRYDNETHVCSACGTHEALMNFAGQELPGPDDWPVVTAPRPAHYDAPNGEDQPLIDYLERDR